MSNLRHSVGNQGLVFSNSSSCPNFYIMLVFPERPENNGGCTGVLDAYSMLESYPKPRRPALDPRRLALRLWRLVLETMDARPVAVKAHPGAMNAFS